MVSLKGATQVEQPLQLNKELDQTSDTRTQPYKASKQRVSAKSVNRPLSATVHQVNIRPKPESPVTEKRILSELDEVKSVVVSLLQQVAKS